MIRKISLFFYCFISTLFWCKASEYDMMNLTSNDGLSNSSVNVILQTSNGLMWFGTWDGLNIYNGKDFKFFKPQFSNKQSISGNIIRDIIEEDRSTYWISTDLGINRFNISMNSFKRFFADTQDQNIFNENSFFIAKNSNNKVFAAVLGKGLFYFDKELVSFISLPHTQHLQFKKIFFDVDDNLWCYTNEKKLYKLVLNKEASSKPFLKNVVEFNHIKDIESIFLNNNDEIWMQKSDKQVFSYHISAGILTPISFSRNINIGTIKTALKKGEDFFLGTESGLFKYDFKTGNLKIILSDTSILSLYSGTQGIIWVGTDMQGIWQRSSPKENFKAYSAANIAGYGKSAVRTFCEDYSNNLWIGTKGNGIYVLKHVGSDNQVKINNHFDKNNGLENNSVFKIVQGFNNELWIVLLS